MSKFLKLSLYFPFCEKVNDVKFLEYFQLLPLSVKIEKCRLFSVHLSTLIVEYFESYVDVIRSQVKAYKT